MTDDIIYFPSDQEIKITITNSDGTAFDLTTADLDITVILYQKKNDQIQEFKKSNTEIDLTSAALGILFVKLDRKNAEDCIEGILLAEVELQLTDTDYADNKKVIRTGEIEVATMKRSAL